MFNGLNSEELFSEILDSFHLVVEIDGSSFQSSISFFLTNSQINIDKCLRLVHFHGRLKFPRAVSVILKNLTTEKKL